MACCCFNRGMMSAHVRLDRDKVQPGEEVGVILEVDNKSKLPVDVIEVGTAGGSWARAHLGGVLSRQTPPKLAGTGFFNFKASGVAHLGTVSPAKLLACTWCLGLGRRCATLGGWNRPGRLVQRPPCSHPVAPLHRLPPQQPRPRAAPCRLCRRPLSYAAEPEA